MTSRGNTSFNGHTSGRSGKGALNSIRFNYQGPYADEAYREVAALHEPASDVIADRALRERVKVYEQAKQELHAARAASGTAGSISA